MQVIVARLLAAAIPTKHVNQSGTWDCLEWAGVKNDSGYGTVSFKPYRGHRAHRVMWIETFGEIEAGLCVLHKCDNRPCINPDHLFKGTRADNNADMTAKGRAVLPVSPLGERNKKSRLTAADVLSIRHRYAAGGVTFRALAIEYGVTKKTIADVFYRNTWRHI